MSTARIKAIVHEIKQESLLRLLERACVAFYLAVNQQDKNRCEEALNNINNLVNPNLLEALISFFRKLLIRDEITRNVHAHLLWKHCSSLQNRWNGKDGKWDISTIIQNFEFIVEQNAIFLIEDMWNEKLQNALLQDDGKIKSILDKTLSNGVGRNSFAKQVYLKWCLSSTNKNKFNEIVNAVIEKKLRDKQIIINCVGSTRPKTSLKMLDMQINLLIESLQDKPNQVDCSDIMFIQSPMQIDHDYLEEHINFMRENSWCRSP
ncbi:MAG: hypothetical protein EPO11_07385 [Gammaproteobacteria bacterium]|nr:MAG: hypothetical protein EPO11_07385 [Gammaproteobacteria bacterium]